MPQNLPMRRQRGAWHQVLIKDRNRLPLRKSERCFKAREWPNCSKVSREEVRLTDKRHKYGVA